MVWEKKKSSQEAFLQQLQLSDSKAYRQKVKQKQKYSKHQLMLDKAKAMVGIRSRRKTNKNEACDREATTVLLESKPLLDSEVDNSKS